MPLALEETLARGRAGDISLDEVLTLLADTELYLPIDDGARFRCRDTEDGRSFVPAFATVEELRKAEPDTPYRVSTGRDLAEDWDPSLWMYVNPEGRTPLMLRADKVSALSSAPVVDSEPPGAGPDPSGVMVSVRAPVDPVPDGLTAVVRAAVARDDVAEGYVFEAQDDAHGARLVIGLVPAPGLAVRDMAPAVAATYGGLRGFSVEVMAIDEALRDVVASSVPPCG
jgi:type III secretion system (T3SS) SseB-like protein